MGILYIMYRRDISRGFIRSLYKGSVYTTQGTSENHIGLRPKIHGSILGSLYNKTRDLNSDFNSILSANK